MIILLVTMISGGCATAYADIFSARRGVSIAPFVRTEMKSTPSGQAVVFSEDYEKCSPHFAGLLRQSGVELVRIVVNPLPLVEVDNRLVRVAANRVATCAAIYVQNDIVPIIDFHFWSPEPEKALARVIGDEIFRERYISALKIVAARLSELRARSTALELLNEPPLCDGRSQIVWTKLQPLLLAAVRSVAPELPVVIAGCGGQLNGLVELNLEPYWHDDNLIFTFHFYEPFYFTHQMVYYGSSFSEIRFPQPALDLGSALAAFADISGKGQIAETRRLQTTNEIVNYLRHGSDKVQLALRLQTVATWAKTNGVAPNRIFLGEFGVVITDQERARASLDADAVRWLSEVRSLADAFGFSYAWWIMPRPSNAMYDTATHWLRKDVLAAIGLHSIGP